MVREEEELTEKPGWVLQCTASVLCVCDRDRERVCVMREVHMLR